MDKLKYIAEQFHLRGIEAYYVGGYVRDKFLGEESEDVDICLVGVMDKEIVPFIVNRVGVITEEHGNKFPNWTVVLDGDTYDFALARRETKSGEKHVDFDIDWFGVSLQEDLERRDLTINAIAEHVLSGKIVDPFGGQLDIKIKELRPTSLEFKKDPLRVIRAARFAAKFPDFAWGLDLCEMCGSLVSQYNTISKERIGAELMKMFKTAKKPSKFFTFLKIVGWLEVLFPDVNAMIGVPQDPIHHPEGDVFVHTMAAMDSVDDWFIRAVMLVHDIAKPLTTTINGVPFKEEYGVPRLYEENKRELKFKIQALGHEDMGATMVEHEYGRLVFGNKKLRKQISILVKLHMLRAKMPLSEKVIRNTLRELINHNLTYLQLYQVIKADLEGRGSSKPPYDLTYQVGLWRANELLKNGDMDPIVTGDLLKELGMIEGKEIGEVVKKALEIQDRGNLTEDNWFGIMKGCGFPFFKNLKVEYNDKV